jgi:hypothetical protein
MNNKKHFFKTNKAGFVLGAALFVALTKCAGNAEAQDIGITVNPPLVVVPPVVVQDDYVYYPSYGTYYNSRRHRYAYLENGVWVSTTGPQRGVSVEALLASPHVKMDFHDAPQRHHAEMMRKYPKNWAPPTAGHEQH